VLAFNSDADAIGWSVLAIYLTSWPNRKKTQERTAVTALLNILIHPATPASVRARAADLTLSRGKDASEEDIEEQLSVLGYAAEVAQAALHGEHEARRARNQFVQILGEVFQMFHTVVIGC
jgi:hypothetical protein